jgi:hypothetical protein
MVYWPILSIPISYFIIQPAYNIFYYSLLQKHSKKLFDMCNLGDEFYLGQKRSEVLQHCNHILNV